MASDGWNGADDIADALAFVDLPDKQDDEIVALEAERAARPGAARFGQVRSRHPRKILVVDGVWRGIDARRRHAMREQVLARERADRQMR